MITSADDLRLLHEMIDRIFTECVDKPVAKIVLNVTPGQIAERPIHCSVFDESETRIFGASTWVGHMPVSTTLNS